jgi:hypothetical protein
MLATNTVLKVLDLSSNNWNQYSDNSGEWLGDGPGFAKELAVGISGNGALSVLNLASNNLGELVLPQGWTQGFTANYSVEYTHTDGTKQDQHPGKPEGILALASAIPDMGALSVLNLASNNLGGWNGKYSSKSRHDTSGNTYNQCSRLCIIPYCFISLQALSPLPMPSLIWGR